ncbi:MAG: hypothetical protein AAGA03_16280, partial [Planctomycetota bacterium]
PGAALSVDGIEEVTAIELSPLVARAAGTYFGDFNHGILDSEAASIVIGDGRTFIASETESFDVVTGDLFLPWSPGTARLYSTEHFASVRRALKPGGVFCQWLPMYQLTPEQFQLIADTFASQFEDTHLFMNHFRVSSPMVALIGGKEAGWLDWTKMGSRCEQVRNSDSVSDPVLRHEPGIRLLYLGPWQMNEARPNRLTLADPSLEYSASMTRLSGDPAKQYYDPTNWVKFCRARQQQYASRSSASSSEQADLMLLATGLLELDYARRTGNELADAIAARVSQEVPRCFAYDLLADMNRWPGQSILWQRGNSSAVGTK